jgi:hypothetical protein
MKVGVDCLNDVGATAGSVRNTPDDLPLVGTVGGGGDCNGGCDGAWEPLGDRLRLGADAVRVAEGFSTMRIGSRSVESEANREGVVSSGGLPSAETEMRGDVVGAGTGGCLDALFVGG